MADVTLTPLTRAHAEQLFAELNDPVMYQYVDEDPPASLAALTYRLERWESRRNPDFSELWLNWAVLVDGAGPGGETSGAEPRRVAGYVQATIPVSGPTEVGYMIGQRWWGQGIGRAGVRLMLAELATKWAVSEVFATVDSRNERSLALLRSLGMHPAPGPDNPINEYELRFAMSLAPAG